MQIWLASLFAQMLPKIMEYLWGIASTEIKQQLANKEYGDYIESLKSKYDKLCVDYEVLQLTHKVSQQDIEKLRNEKIKLETQLLNSKHP